jgi:hypothetical protein
MEKIYDNDIVNIKKIEKNMYLNMDYITINSKYPFFTLCVRFSLLGY